MQLFCLREAKLLQKQLKCVSFIRSKSSSQRVVAIRREDNVVCLKLCAPSMKLQIYMPYLFDCKPWQIKLFFIISYGLQLRVAYVFFFSLSRCLDDT